MGDGNMGSAEDEAGVSPCAPIENLPPSAVAPPRRWPGVCASSSAQGPHVPPWTSNGKLALRWPFKDGGGRGGRRISPRSEGGTADLCF